MSKVIFIILIFVSVKIIRLGEQLIIITITTWFKFLGKNLHLVGCTTLCTKSEVMLMYVFAEYRALFGFALF